MIRPGIVLRGDTVGFPLEFMDTAATAQGWITVGHANKIKENVYYLRFDLSAYGKNGYYTLYNDAFVPIERTGQAA